MQHFKIKPGVPLAELARQCWVALGSPKLLICLSEMPDG